MKVKKRSGRTAKIAFDKISRRLNRLCLIDPKIENVEISFITQKVCSGIYDGITTKEIDILSSEISISLSSKDPDYGYLASRIIISNHHKNTKSDYLEKTKILYENSVINKNYYELVVNNIDKINETIDYSNDYRYDFFGFKTLERAYLLKSNSVIIERPQDMLMRVSLSLHRNNLEKALDCYNMMSNHDFIHATPTLFNAGTNKEQFSSCFLLSMEDDSVIGIYDTLKDCAIISQNSGGIGLHIHNVRPSGSHIKGTGGTSNGIVPMLRVFNDTARYIDQGGGKRNGSFAIYIEPWHGDIYEFLELKKNHGNELEKARDLFYGLWIPDLFMKKVSEDGDWCLFSETDCPGLSNNYGEKFNELYFKYENDNKYIKKISARDLWLSILTCQIETGNPYILYKDKCNEKSNQKNLGTIKSSNLCTEIIEYSDKEETAVCNLASISIKSCLVHPKINDILIIYTKNNCIYCKMAINLCKKLNIEYKTKSQKEFELSKLENKSITYPKIYIENENQKFIGGYEELEKFTRPYIDYNKLKNISKILTNNLNNTIDFNKYPTAKTKRSNFRHRPIGIGIQGLANIYYEMKISFTSDEAKDINKKIFETIYYGSLEASMELSKEREEIIKNYLKNKDDDIKIKYNILDEEINRDKYLGTYSTYIGCPIYNGIYQNDMWNVITNDIFHDWTTLKSNIKKYGIRNSLLCAPMPTASTSQILNNYECFEPVLSNIYSRRVLAGDYVVINNYMVNDLKLCNMWSDEIKDSIILNNGSVSHLDIPNTIKNRYKTCWELKQKDLIDMSRDRGAYICQSQSLNLFQESPTFKKLSAMHMYSWKQGLKTGLYYLRTRPSCKPIQFTISPDSCESCSG